MRGVAGAVTGVWRGATALLAAAVFAGRLALVGATPAQLALPLAFPGGAGAGLSNRHTVLAPEAFGQGGPLVALPRPAGFFTSFMLSPRADMRGLTTQPRSELMGTTWSMGGAALFDDPASDAARS
ncbi:MAG: hypothetical protein M3308_07715 [Actinomycetota bacterium]|nr:hypothetical protein [Actinomycetota bacterium]